LMLSEDDKAVGYRARRIDGQCYWHQRPLCETVGTRIFPWITLHWSHHHSIVAV